LVVSGGKFLSDEISGVLHAGVLVAGVGGAPPRIIDGAGSGALALEDVLESVEAVFADSLESAVQENIPSTVSRLTINAATA
jgi:hypothetical protein